MQEKKQKRLNKKTNIMPDRLKTMSLKEFLDKTGMPVADFARRAGIGRNTVYKLLEGGNVTLDVIMAVEHVTEGQVTHVEIFKSYMEKLKLG